MAGPPVASTRPGAVTRVPSASATRNAVSRATSVTRWPSRISTPAAAHSAISIATICRAEPSQNNCPSVFSWKAMRCLATSAMKSCCV